MRRLTIGVFLLAAVTASCIDAIDPLPLDITMTASKATTVAADSISFVVNAQGNTLLGVEADFGDGSAAATQPTQGARTAKVTFRHAYTGIGTFQVTATVTDAVLGSKSATVQVQIQ